MSRLFFAEFPALPFAILIHARPDNQRARRQVIQQEMTSQSRSQNLGRGFVIFGLDAPYRNDFGIGGGPGSGAVPLAT